MPALPPIQTLTMRMTSAVQRRIAAKVFGLTSCNYISLEFNCIFMNSHCRLNNFPAPSRHRKYMFWRAFVTGKSKGRILYIQIKSNF